MEQKRICKDCKHYRRHWLFGSEFAECKAPIRTETNKVSGRAEVIRVDTFCAVERDFFSRDCGPHGKLFEARPAKLRSWYTFWRAA